MGERKQRVSITKLQRETALAVDLIALCQTVTEDGSLSDEEIGALRAWLQDNDAADLPAKAFLRQVVEQILSDGIVTEEERLELLKAIEAVLPPDIRDTVRSKRTAVQKAAREQVRAERAAAKQTALEERTRNEPLDDWDFMVAGSCYEGRPRAIERYAIAGESVYLVRQPGNRFSKNAIVIRMQNGMDIGYVPEQDAVEIAPWLDSGHRYEAYIKKILSGRNAPIPVLVASVFSPEAERTDLASPHEAPPRVGPPAGVGTGCATVMIVLALIVVMFSVLGH